MFLQVLSFITFVGATTAFFSATIGLVQNDIKKVIAYSTCSQLGYMIFACGLSNYHVSLFHLANHAFFKALLFLSAGAIIHSVSNEQDMRKFGGFAVLLPFTSIMLLIGSLSLMGFPFLTGFYSKDLILEIALTKYTIEGSLAYFLGLITAFFTSFYSFRVFYMTFIYKNNSFRTAVTHVHELPWKMAVSLSVLSIGSIFFGYIAKDLFVGLGTDFWNHSILILPEHNNQLDAEFFGLPPLALSEMQFGWNATYSSRWIKLLPFLSSLIAVALVYFLFRSFFYSKNVDFERLTPRQRSVILKPPYIIDVSVHQLQVNYNVEYVYNNDSIRQTFSIKPAYAGYTNIFTEAREFCTKGILQLYMPEVHWNETDQVRNEKVLPFSVDDPLTPSIAVVNNPEYSYYQEILWKLTINYKWTIMWNMFIMTLPKKYLKYNSKDIAYELYEFLSYKWYFDGIYNELINRPLLKMAYETMYRSLDKGVLEVFGPYGVSYAFSVGARNIKKMQIGKVLLFAFAFTCWILIVLIAREFIDASHYVGSL